MKKKTTVKDVAIAAGVSKASVSLVLNNRECNIPDSTKQRIRQTAEKLDYTPNHIARSLATNQTKTIGVIIPNISNIFFSEVVRNIQIELNQHGYDIFLCDSDEQLENDLRYIKLLSSRNVDALILTMSAESLTKENQIIVKELLDDTEVPYVLLDRYFDQSCPKVVVDNLNGGYEVTKFLIENGHQKIGFITGPMNLNSSIDRLAGVQKAFKEYHIEFNPNYVFSGKYDIETGHQGGLNLLEDVTAIFAFNDMQAFGVIEAAKEKKISIPNQVSLVGFDDTIYSSIIEPQLTTVRQPVKELAMEVCKTVLKCISDNECKDEVRLSTELVIRNSVKKIETRRI